MVKDWAFIGISTIDDWLYGFERDKDNLDNGDGMVSCRLRTTFLSKCKKLKAGGNA
jgi:hypothetical protein